MFLTITLTVLRRRKQNRLEKCSLCEYQMKPYGRDMMNMLADGVLRFELLSEQQQDGLYWPNILYLPEDMLRFELTLDLLKLINRIVINHEIS